ncbi:energy transducer TonB [Pedobacter kyungheensis]|uniref:Energy transducer TonB n=1 Tax=Pedobacter kyungheensis TaxID=1069985 RepID=A0A0C1DCH5_9SPHI|nr:TonB family protein [Pedobacter kyungheensis]KIA95311.1 energy transducer TonB [Pedobacter kyungheensis]
MKYLFTICLVFCCVLGMAQVQFKSGKSGFTNFLRDNTIYPQFSKDNCIQGTVNVSFKLDENGKVYFSKISKGILSELDEEALRLVRLSSGKWQVPAGYDTTVSIVAPVKFQLSGYNCEGKSNDEIQEAIRNYQAEEGLTNSVINFYKNIDQAKPGQEIQIMAIKNQLGIDDEYLDDRIKMGLKKIKQDDKQGACEDFLFVKYMGSKKADDYLAKYCK